MRTRTMVLSLTAAAAALLPACAAPDSAAPPPSTPVLPSVPPPTTTPAPTTSPVTRMPPMPRVAEAEVTITKTTPPPPPGVPCGGGADACIDLSANKSWLLADGEVTFGPVPITHGRPGWLTPPGTFNVGWKDIDHLSSEFDNAPMPYSVFFNGGIAFHEGSLTDLSHGCIHLSNAAAQRYYEDLAVGDVVQVVP
jgi:lipoprotein-anchoring transpeptidase ErfK/SrfK